MKENIKWLWFDLDNTLVDFSSASKKSFFQCFDDHKLEANSDTYDIYSKINLACWQAFEAGAMTAMDIREKRFTQTLAALKHNGIDGLQFNALYMKHLVQFTKAYEGVSALLSKLKEQYKIAIITNGLKEAQRPRLRITELYDLFDQITVSDEIGHSKPNRAFFQHAYDLINDNNLDPSEILVIGDSLNSDIRGGQGFGCETCWLSHGKENNSDILPDHTINNISEFSNLILK